MEIFLFWFKFIPPNYIVHLYTWMALSKAHTFAQAQQSPQTNNSNKPSPISNSSALYHSKYNTSHNCFPSRIHFKLYSMINTCHIKKVPWEMNDDVENILFCFVKESVKKKSLHPSFHLDLHQKLMSSILVQDPSSIQVMWKCVD